MMNAHRVLLAAAACLAFAACPGPAGPAGEACTVTDNGNGTSNITCSGTTVTVKNGTNGTNGTSCTVAANPDAGTKTITCTDGTVVTVTDGRPGVDANATIDFAKMTDAEKSAADFAITVQSISGDAKPVVRFTVRDAKGAGVRGIPSAPVANNFSGIAVMQLVPGSLADGGNGLNIDTWVSHITNCATCTSSTETADSTSLVDNNDGTYTYTFKKDIINPTPYGDAGLTAVAGVAFDANAPHRFGMRLGVSGNPYRPVDVVYDYIPATGENITGKNDKVLTANCLECHVMWRANALNAGGAVPFHSGMRYETQYCVICHNDQQKYSGSSAAGNSVIAEPTINGNVLTGPGGKTISVFRGEALFDQPVWIHKIHRGKDLYYQSAKTDAGIGTFRGESAAFGINDIAFPQDLRNCNKCHQKAAKGDNWKTKPSRRACGACHDNVDFSNHQGQNLTDDRMCTTCHNPTGLADIVTKHIPVAPPDPNNILSNDAGSGTTNASYLASALNPPAGARVFSYAIPNGGVTAVPLGDGGVNAKVTFKLLEADGGNVVFNAAGGSAAEMLDNFVGSPSVYCAFALPEDLVAAPADFNATVSGYLKRIWNGTATGGASGTLTGPDSSGYYSVQLTGVTIPRTATMLTCGLGYTYSLSATSPNLPTPPLVQTNAPGFPYDGGVGGLAVPAQNVWAVAAGYVGRRNATSSSSTTGQIVDTKKCNACHNGLGITPTYHAGQRNDAATCAFCHTPNRTSSGWSAGSESFVHGIHSAQFRHTQFNWHATSATQGFYETTYPGRLQFCESCHNAGYFDFSNTWYTEANMARRLVQTVATETKSTDIALSPYVDAGVIYGSGWSYTAGSQAVTEATGTTLVISPITNVCFACHDSAGAQAHMRLNGGVIYGDRATALTKVEQCLICHGPGKVAAIKDVHYK